MSKKNPKTVHNEKFLVHSPIVSTAQQEKSTIKRVGIIGHLLGPRFGDFSDSFLSILTV